MAIIYGNEKTKVREGNVGIVDGWVNDSQSDRATWESNIVKWYKLRTRVKKDKTFPFPNCSNLRLPTLDIKIKKVKSKIRNGVLGVRPVVQVIPSPSGNYEVAVKIEKLLDHLIMDVIKYHNKFIITVDQSSEIGFFINKPYWRLEIQEKDVEINLSDFSIQFLIQLFESKDTDILDVFAEKYAIDKHKYVWKENHEKLLNAVDKFLSGESSIKFKSQDVTYNFPDVALIHPQNCYVNNEGGYHPETQPHIVYEYWIRRDELQARAKSQGWDISGVDATITASEVSDELESVKDSKEGIVSFRKTGKIKIWEGYGWVGTENPKKLLIVTAPDFNAELKVQSLPLPSGNYGFVKFFHELREDRWYHHRGYPDILEDLIKEIDVQHMQKIDRQTIVNSPMFLGRAGMISQSTTQMLFGQMITVNGMQPLNDILTNIDNYNQAADFSYDREQQILKADIDEYTGMIDFTLSQQLNRREPRTAEEVSMQSSDAAMVASLDISLYRASFEELANIIWELWCEYGEDSYEFMYFGSSLKGEKIKLNKEEIQGKYLIKVMANDENVNPSTRIAKAQQILSAVANPLALQLGVTTPINVAMAYKRFFQELNIDNAEDLYTIPQPKEPGVPPDTIPKFKDLEEMEQAQVLQKLGIQPNTMQRMIDKEREIRNQKTDNFTNIINSMR